jgi:hypothetical protein
MSRVKQTQSASVELLSAKQTRSLASLVDHENVRIVELPDEGAGFGADFIIRVPNTGRTSYVVWGVGSEMWEAGAIARRVLAIRDAHKSRLGTSNDTLVYIMMTRTKGTRQVVGERQRELITAGVVGGADSFATVVGVTDESDVVTWLKRLVAAAANTLPSTLSSDANTLPSRKGLSKRDLAALSLPVSGPEQPTRSWDDCAVASVDKAVGGYEAMNFIGNCPQPYCFHNLLSRLCSTVLVPGWGGSLREKSCRSVGACGN